MGWEEILDAEGADMADAYNDSLPEETYETVKVYDPEQDKKSEMDSMRRLVESYEEEKDRIEYICDFEGVPDVLVYDAYKDDIVEDVISEELLGPDISFVDMSHDQLMKAWTKFGQDALVLQVVVVVKVRGKLTRYEADKLKVSLQVALSQVEE